MRKENLAIGEHYHIYNRGADKRDIFLDPSDSKRFLRSLVEFNTLKPIGSLYENSFKKERENSPPLVNIICYCLNPNHFHLVLEQTSENGISKLFHKLAAGYTSFFNKKYKRTGVLFQGAFRAKHIADNDYLLRVSAYVNANDKIHKLDGSVARVVRSSLKEFTEPENAPVICKKDVVLEQFDSPTEYQNYVEELIPEMIEVKTLEREQELADLWHES